MKANIKQHIEAAINDNRQHIIEFGGNIYQYLHADYANSDQGQNWYLTDEEIAEWETGDEEVREKYINQITDLIERYDYIIK